MTKDEALRMALEALTFEPKSYEDYLVSRYEALAAIDAALAQKESER